MNSVRVSPRDSMPSLNKPWPLASVPVSVKVRERPSSAELAGADACAKTTGGAR